MSQGLEHAVYLGLGSSLGDRLGYLQEAVNNLSAYQGSDYIGVEAVSYVYESPHLGLMSEDEGNYPPHLNVAIKITTNQDPYQLLKKIHDVERAGGRERLIHWGPRTIDIDILLFGDLTLNTERLQIPHPGLPTRSFVLLPLSDIAPGLRLPNGDTVAGAAARIMSDRPTIIRTTAEIYNPCAVGRR